MSDYRKDTVQHLYESGFRELVVTGVGEVEARDDRITDLERRNGELEAEKLERQAIVLANARRLIKAKKITTNAGLYRELFGTGHGTARDRCRTLGLDPDSNETSYSKSMEAIEALTRTKEQTHE